MVLLNSLSISKWKLATDRKCVNSYSYLVLDLVTLAFSVFMESAFHCAVLAISSDMLTTEGSTLKNKYTFLLVFSTCKSINNVIIITYIIFAFINLKLRKLFAMHTKQRLARYQNTGSSIIKVSWGNASFFIVNTRSKANSIGNYAQRWSFWLQVYYWNNIQEYIIVLINIKIILPQVS